MTGWFDLAAETETIKIIGYLASIKEASCCARQKTNSIRTVAWFPKEMLEQKLGCDERHINFRKGKWNMKTGKRASTFFPSPSHHNFCLVSGQPAEAN